MTVYINLCVPNHVDESGARLWLVCEASGRQLFFSSSTDSQWVRAVTMPAGHRQRFDGALDSLVDIVADSATTPDFLRYSTDINAPLQSTRILAHANTCQRIRPLCPRFVFSQATMESVFVRVAERNRDVWPKALTDSELDDWNESISKQFRSMARAINQALVKNPRRAWLQELWRKGGSGDTPTDGPAIVRPDLAEADSPEAPSPPTVGTSLTLPGFFCGYDLEHEKAWRAPSDRPHEKEYAIDHEVPSGASPDDPILAVFADGAKVVIPSVSVGEHKQRLETPSSSAAPGMYWQGRYDHKRISITKRKDRSPLLILYMDTNAGKTKQLCQLALKHFGDVDLEEPLCRCRFLVSIRIRAGRTHSSRFGLGAGQSWPH